MSLDEETNKLYEIEINKMKSHLMSLSMDASTRSEKAQRTVYYHRAVEYLNRTYKAPVGYKGESKHQLIQYYTRSLDNYIEENNGMKHPHDD